MRVCVRVCLNNWPLPIGAFQDQCKHKMINKYLNIHNYVKNPNWWGADQVAIYKHRREVEQGQNRIWTWNLRISNPVL